jgi:hypothetical protein
MRNRIIRWTLSLAMLVGISMLFVSCEADMNEVQAGTIDMRGPNDYNPASVCTCINDNFPIEALSSDESKAILFMREEEKLARDFYTEMNQKWNARVFYNISKAEQRHMDAMLCLINKYGLTDPVGDNAAGEFQDAGLQQLYDALMTEGEQSYEMALKAGAKIEDVDINDLMTAVNDIDNQDMPAVFEELTKGSRNHMRAFVANLATLDATYTPQFISQELFDEITSTPREKGGGLCGNCIADCQGNGQGNGGNCNGQGNGGNGNGQGNGGNCNGQGNGGNGNGN